MTFTDEQKAIIDNERTIKYVRIEFPNHEIEDVEAGQIYQESLNLEESISESGNIVFGKCNGSIFKIRVADFTENIEQAKMNVYITFTNEDLGSVEVPFGKYVIQTTERTSDRRWRDITAADYMTLFDVEISDWFNNTLFPTDETKRTVKQVRELLCNHIGIEFEEVTLVNDDLSVGKNIEPQSLSGREYLQEICEISGCFGHFDWDGVLRFITLDSSTSDVEEIKKYRNDGVDYEDYSVHAINSVGIIKEDGGLAVTYDDATMTSDNKNRYLITGNSFLYGFDEDDLEDIAEKIYGVISKCDYRPNTTQIPNHVYMPLGSAYTVASRTIVGSEYVDTTFQSFLLSRTISGIQDMWQTVKAEGEQYQPETQTHDIMKEITILKGKSATYKRDLDSLEIEYKDFEEQVDSRFTQTAEGITAEVARTYATKDEVSDVDDKFNDVYTKTETDAKITILSDSITLTVEELENLQKQINNELESYVGDEQPTPANSPANKWTSEQKKQKVGTKYYCTDGTTWQWMYGMLIYASKSLIYDNETLVYYYWQQVTDAGIAEALLLAKNALNTADDVSQTLVNDYSTTKEVNSLIEQTKESIELGVSETYATQANLETVDGKFANVYTQKQTDEKITLATGSITSEVSETYATKTEVGNIQVGAENLILNSLDFVGDTHFMFNNYLTYNDKLLTYNGNRLCY